MNNGINVSGIICRYIEDKEEDFTSLNFIEVNNNIRVDKELNGSFNFILIANGYIEDDEVIIKPYIINEKAKKELELGETIVKRNDPNDNYINVRCIYDIRTSFPEEGDYSIIAKLENNIIKDSFITNFRIYK